MTCPTTSTYSRRPESRLLSPLLDQIVSSSENNPGIRLRSLKLGNNTVPGSLVEALIAIVSLLPGWVYGQRRGRYRPRSDRSNLRDLVDILSISAFTWTLLIVFSIAFEFLAPDANLLYVGDLYSDLAAGTLGDRIDQWILLFVASTTVATAIGWITAFVAFGNEPADRQNFENGWRVAFKRPAASSDNYTRVAVKVGAERWVRGWLYDFPGELLSLIHI